MADAIELEANAYNRQAGPAAPKFRVWSAAGLMLTYWCPSRCACCYVHAGSEAGDPETEMSQELALACWRGVRRLAGERGRVHLTGGEPFGDFERLEEILRQGQAEGLCGLEKIETNAYWCTEDGLVRDRLVRLKALGLRKLQVSTDVYHQRYVPMERVRRAVEVGRGVLGQEGVQVRWLDFYAEPTLVGPMGSEERSQAFRRALKRRGERLLGRAAEELAGLFPSRRYDTFADETCSRNLLGAGHVHVDGAGNVFLGTCVGIVAGKVREGESSGLEGLWRSFDWREHPVISVLVREGPAGLGRRAEGLGFQAAAGYAGKCHLCHAVRRFLFEQGSLKDWLGPGVCYGLRVAERQCSGGLRRGGRPAQAEGDRPLTSEGGRPKLAGQDYRP